MNSGKISSDFFNIYFYLFIWLCQVLVAAYGIFSCSMWNLVPRPGVKPRPPAMGTWNLSYWITRDPQVIFFFFFTLLFQKKIF